MAARDEWKWTRWLIGERFRTLLSRRRSARRPGAVVNRMGWPIASVIALPCC